VLALMAEYSVLCAVETGKADLVAAAVAKGCNMNETDQEGNSCLHIAAAQGSNDILRILLNAGANITAKNKAGRKAVERAQNAQTIEVLKAAGATMPEIPDEKKNTLLLEYAGKGLTGGVLMALQAGADANHKDRDSDTALHHAACNGRAPGRRGGRQREKLVVEDSTPLRCRVRASCAGPGSWARGRTSTRKTVTLRHR
jgi:ankyrin repeat protein